MLSIDRVVVGTRLDEIPIALWFRLGFALVLFGPLVWFDRMFTPLPVALLVYVVIARHLVARDMRRTTEGLLYSRRGRLARIASQDIVDVSYECRSQGFGAAPSILRIAYREHAGHSAVRVIKHVWIFPDQGALAIMNGGTPPSPQWKSLWG